MKQTNITAEEELRRAAIDRLIEARLADSADALELLLAKWRNISKFDSDEFKITRIPFIPPRLPLTENTKREEQ